MILVVMVLGVSSILGACGRKGPLFLPEEATTPAATQPSSGASAVPEVAPPAPDERRR